MNLSLRRTSARRPSASAEAESWFLERGLPSVLTRRDRWRRLWPRSAPMLAAYATTQACGIPIYLITGGHEVRGENPTTAEWVLLAFIAAILPLAAVVAVVLLLTGCGVGSVVGWAVRMMLSHLATIGALAVRALSVVLLTALVFFISAMAGNGVSGRHRSGLCHICDPGTGQADAAVDRRSAHRPRKAGRHAVRDDARYP